MTDWEHKLKMVALAGVALAICSFCIAVGVLFAGTIYHASVNVENCVSWNKHYGEPHSTTGDWYQYDERFIAQDTEHFCVRPAFLGEPPKISKQWTTTKFQFGTIEGGDS